MPSWFIRGRGGGKRSAACNIFFMSGIGARRGLLLELRVLFGEKNPFRYVLRKD